MVPVAGVGPSGLGGGIGITSELREAGEAKEAGEAEEAEEAGEGGDDVGCNILYKNPLSFFKKK